MNKGHNSVKLSIIYYGTVQKRENYGPKFKTVYPKRPFFYLMIVVAIMTVAHLTTMTVITLADITGKEAVVAASVIVPKLTGTFGIIRIGTNMDFLKRSSCSNKWVVRKNSQKTWPVRSMFIIK